ncbi:MAG TPA: metallopeptidase family protein [Polyangia bacterium]|nr:metallopeptidase family protein [Polyangia bacterium]
MRRWAVQCVLLLGLFPGCTSHHRLQQKPEESESARMGRLSTVQHAKTVQTPDVRPARRCFPEDGAGAPERPLEALLDRAADRYDDGDYEGALLCADEAARQASRSIEAHHNRAAALAQLGRLDEARTAFTRALALDPDDPETLAGAADLYINRLPPAAELTEIGLEYARRGVRSVKRLPGERRNAQAARLALLEGQALDDLGRAKEALPRLDYALRYAPGDLDAEYEKGVALFELCRFPEARREFGKVLDRNPDNAYAHHHLGLILEREGKEDDARRHFARARVIAAGDFPAPVDISREDFRRAVDRALAELPEPLRRDLKGVPVQVADLPAAEDLTAEDPPLSPTILGLYRGLPLGQVPPPGVPDEPRSIVLYRKNLARAVSSLDELDLEIRKTLLHELGHLHGEDDQALRSRGLE